MKPRKQYTQKEKMRALFELSLGNNAKDALISAGYDTNNPDITDKKYCAKLINKWKHIIYSNKDYHKAINELYNFIYFKNKTNDDFIEEKYIKKDKDVK